MSLKFAQSASQRYKIQRWTLAVQTYSALEICKVYHTKIQTIKGWRWRYKLSVVYHTKIQKIKDGHSWICKTTMQRYAHSRVDGGDTTYSVILSFSKFTIQRYKYLRVDIGVTNLQFLCNLQKATVQRYKNFKGGRWRYKLTVSFKIEKSLTKIQRFKGGRWQYKLKVCLNIATSTIQKYKNWRVYVGDANLQCVWILQSLPYQDTKV